MDIHLDIAIILELIIHEDIMYHIYLPEYF